MQVKSWSNFSLLLRGVQNVIPSEQQGDSTTGLPLAVGKGQVVSSFFRKRHAHSALCG